jgi:spoIIIJ-associated protein
MNAIEKTGATVEEAIAAGLEELGANPTDVMVEVLEEPSGGLLGLGAKPARVRIILMTMPQQPEAPVVSKSTDEGEKASSPKDDSNVEQRQERRQSDRSRSDRPRNSRRNDNRRRNNDRDNDRNRGGHNKREDRYDLIAEPAPDMIPDSETEEVARVGKDVLDNILIHMGFEDAQIGIHRAESTREDEELHWILNVYGTGIDSLIGRRGDTLASLQYIVRLIVSRRIQQHASLIIDVGQFKARRSERLMQLAHRMADQAVADERSISLEPMPPHERRIIHLALRERADVETFSVGEGKTRKVTISPNLQ